MVYVIAFSSPDSLVISSISLCDQNYAHLLNYRYHDYSCCRDKVNRAAGQRAVVMVFASPSGQFYHDVTNPAHLSGLSHLDNFIVTRNLLSFIGTVQKHMPTPTQTATPYTTGPLCVIAPAKPETVYIREFIMTQYFLLFIRTYN